MLSILRRARRTNANVNNFSPLRTALLLPLVLALSLLGSAAQAQVDVTATAGNTGPVTYATLQLAFAAVNDGTHQGVVTMAVTADTTETATAVLNASGSGAAVYSAVTVSPTGGAARTISGAIAGGSPLIDLNGADNVTIDGLNTGGNALTISNTTVSATAGTSTIRFIGGATANTITNTSILGSSNAAVTIATGTILLSTDATTVNGNDNNTISNNNIGPAGANFPSKGVMSLGTTTTVGNYNSGINITGNNIFDYFGAAVTSAGVYFATGTTDCNVNTNKFYQTGTRTQTTGAQHSAIWMLNSTGNNFQVNSNTIGFASSAGTGTYTFVGIGTGSKFDAIFLDLGATTASTVQGNTITAINLSGVVGGTSVTGAFVGIAVNNGLVTIGNVTGNTIGSAATAGAISVTSNNASAMEVRGIYYFPTATANVSNNTVAGIVATNSGAGSLIVVGIHAFTGSALVNTMLNNVVGTVAAPISNTSASTASRVIGLHSQSGASIVTGNTISNLSMNGANVGTAASAALIGLLSNNTSSTFGNNVSQNTVRNLSHSAASAAVWVTGIAYNGSTTGTHVVARNLVHGLSTPSTSATATVNGINLIAGNATYPNNMIAVGSEMTANSPVINGFNEAAGANNLYHNSVYIGGSAVAAGTANSFALQSVVTTSTRNYRDNIFYNARSNGAATGKHYAIRVGGTAPNPAGLTTNNNILLANGTGGFTGLFNGIDQLTIALWRTATGQDFNSFAGDPQYLAPTAATPDLHINPSIASPAEANGALIAAVTDDFDGQTRSGLTPTDIGADAGNFIFVDLAAPSIAYTAFANTSLTTNRTLTATLTDVTGVATGGLAPRIYYRKGAGSYFSQPCSLTSGTVNSGTWDCVVNNVDVGGVVATDVISYYVIAQDSVGNVGSNPAGVVAADVNTITTPPTPNSYTIVPALSGTLNVGTAEAITSLTNAGGLFEAINAGALTSNLVINITSDLTTELGTNALNQWAEDGVGGYTLLIRPSGAPRTVSGTNAGSLFRLNGVDRLTIDGSTTGGTAVGVGGNAALRELTFQNTNVGTSAVVMSLQTGTNGAQNNVIKNVVILGQDPTTTLAGLALGGNTPGTAGTDNDNNRVENVAVKRSIYGIYSAGFGAANPNTGTVITRNDLAAAAADRIRRVGIVVFNDDGVQVTENSIGSMSTNESADGIGIGIGAQTIDTTSVASGGVTNALVARNKIDGVASLSTTGFSAAGIAVAGGTTGPNTIVNNMIDGVTAPATSPDIVAGIWVAGVAGSSTRVYANTVALAGDRGTVASQIGSYAIAITGSNPTVDLKDNILANSQTTTGGGANAKSYAIGMTSATFGNLDSNFNDFFASGASAGFFRTGSIDTTGTDLATLGAWQIAVSDDANSLAVDPLLTSATDLHLGVGSPMLNAGSPVAGVTVDIDGDPRPLTTPDIGADEIVAGTLAFSSATYSDGESAGTTTITVTRTGGSTGIVSIDYATVAGGSATGGAACGGTVDYVDASGTLTFVDSDVSESFTVTLCPDALNEANETVNLALTNPVGGAILGTPNTAVLTINDDDPAPTISITDVTQAELNASTSLFGFVVSLSAPSGQTVTVHYETNDGTATIANSDYVDIPDTILTFNPGVTIGNVDVTVNGDTAPEGNETFFVDLSTATNASILDNQGLGTITNDDASSGPVTVTATAGTLGPTDYATLKAAFDAINAGTHQGAISIEIVSSVVETATAALNASGSGAAVYTSVVVRPSNPGVSVSGSIVGAIIKLNGADNVTIDGRVGGVGSLRSLTVQNTNTSAATAAIWVSSNGALAGSTNNVIRNLEIACGTDTSSSSNATFGIIMSGTTISATANGNDNDNNQFLFNRIVKARYGIVTRGVTTNLNVAPVVTDNIIGPAAFGSDQIGKVGILMQADTGATVSRNIVQSVGCLDAQACSGADRVGIAIGTESWSMSPGTITSSAYTVTHNVIHDVIEETTFSSVGLLLGTTGGGVATNNLVANNFIYNVRANGTGGDQAVGLGIAGGHTDVVVNNSIAMTGDTDPGASVASDNFGSGIRIANVNGANHLNLALRNNSVYMDLSSSSAPTVRYYAISGNSAAYAFGTGGEDFNNYYINPSNTQLQTGGLGTAAGATLTTQFASLANWQTAYTVPQDASSLQANPNHFSPTADLHLLGSSPNIDTGTTVAAVTVDIDNEARPNGPAYDIGADEFYPAPGVLQLSSATYSGNEGTTLVATVNRVSGATGAVGATYTLANGSATGGAACTAGVDFIDPGAQLLSFGDMVTSQPINVTLCSDAGFEAPETFTITLSLPTGGATLGSPTVATASIVNIAPPFSGPFSVGTGENYTSLTNPGGIFEAINLSGATGNVVISITSDLTAETGTFALNQIAGGFTVSIQPSGGAPRTVSGSNAIALLRLDGADNVTFDGLNTGGNALTLRNTNNGGATLQLINDASSNSVLNCTIEGGNTNTGSGVIFLGAGTVTGNDNNTFASNVIRDRTDVAAVPANLFVALNGSLTITNSFNTLNNNALRNFTANGFAASAGLTNDNWTITNNDIFQDAARTSTLIGINLGGAGGTNTISGNSIHEFAASGTNAAVGMLFGAGNTINVSQNRVFNFPGVAGATGQIVGLLSNGVSGGTPNLTLTNNFISIVPTVSTNQVIKGIHDFGFGGNIFTARYNTIYIGGTSSGTAASWALVRGDAAPTTYTAKNNLAFNNRTGGGANHFAGGDQSANTGTFDSNFNFFAGTGATAANFMDYGVAAAGTPISFAAWQTGPPARDANSIGNTAASFIVGDFFVNQDAGDLHLKPTATPVLNAGTTIAGVTVDIDNDPRPPATPDIGADELVQANLSISKDDGVSVVLAGGSTTYVIVASNAGAHNVTGATVTDTLPGALTCNWTCFGTLGGTCTASGSGSLNDTVNLPAGGSVTYVLNCTISPSATGTIDNTASVSSATNDPDNSNNSDLDSDTVNTVIADVSITKTDGSATAIPGTTVTYTIVASNAGPVPAPTVTIVDNFAASLSGCQTTCVASVGSSCTAGPVPGNINDVASLLVGGTATYSATCNISATAIGGLSNTATAAVGGGVTDPALGNNTATDNDTLVPTADVSITKDDGSATATPGAPISYTIVVTNAGPSAAPTVGVLDLFPATLTSCATTCVGAGGGSCTAGPVVGNVNETANLPVGGSATYTANCIVSLSATGTLVNTATATVNGGGTDPNTVNNSATDTDTIPLIFVDGFESGDMLQWSAFVPLTSEAYAALGVDSTSTEAAFNYDFAAVKSGEELAATAVAVVTDAAGKPLFFLGARRIEPNGELELSIGILGAGRSAWVPVSEVPQQVRIEWSLADKSSLGHVAVALDGLVVLSVDEYSGIAAPSRVTLLRSPAP